MSFFNKIYDYSRNKRPTSKGGGDGRVEKEGEGRKEKRGREGRERREGKGSEGRDKTVQFFALLLRSFV